MNHMHQQPFNESSVSNDSSKLVCSHLDNPCGFSIELDFEILIYHY